MRKQKGFSLIELLIVVAIILIIAAIAIPNLLAARKSANESSAAGSLRTLNTTQVNFNTQFPLVGFAGGAGGGTALVQLGPGTGACNGANLIDNQLAAGVKSGYTVVNEAAGPAGVVYYNVVANPANTTACNAGQTVTDYAFSATPASTSVGHRAFCTDVSAVIKQDNPPPPALGVGATCATTLAGVGNVSNL